MIDGWERDDPPPVKKLPVEVDVPELLALIGCTQSASEREKAVGDLALVAFYYLLRVGEYTTKATRNSTKRTVQFRMKDVTFFKRNTSGSLRQLSRSAASKVFLTADGATLKLDNQKNGWKGVCIHHEANGSRLLCPVRALGRRYAHLQQHNADGDTFLSAYFCQNERRDVTNRDISLALKMAAQLLDYPAAKGIPIHRVDTHSLRGGGANALSLAGYSDREIQKMGRWRGATFKEYIREELACFSKGMSTAMSKRFHFVNIAGGVFSDVTDQVCSGELTPGN